jgi:hypothetical protein
MTKDQVQDIRGLHLRVVVTALDLERAQFAHNRATADHENYLIQQHNEAVRRQHEDIKQRAEQEKAKQNG